MTEITTTTLADAELLASDLVVNATAMDRTALLELGAFWPCIAISR